MAEINYKEYARQMRENCAKDHNGNIICSDELWEQIASIIENIPTADVAEVKHGEWEEHDSSEDNFYHHRCSICKVDAPFNQRHSTGWIEGLPYSEIITGKDE